MKTDIFEDMKERVGCENISDLPYRKRMVWEIIKQHSPLDYPKDTLKCLDSAYSPGESMVSSSVFVYCVFT